jgi:hypothetical protein
MSKIGNHRVEVQESEDYRRGWKAAERGVPEPKPLGKWIYGAVYLRRLGWQDYHDPEKNK